MKKFIKIAIPVITFIICGYLVYDNYYKLNNRIEYIYTKYFQGDIKQTLNDNPYRKKENYDYVKINENTILTNKEEVKNAIYTFIDAGWKQYVVKCDPDYLDCETDIKQIVENNTHLTDISNFVHPFNTFEKVNTSISSSGKITLKKQNRYTDEQIENINKKVDEIYKKNYDQSKGVKENIKIFHDYIINNTKYDSSNKSGVSSINSSTAYGVLFDGVGICSGYTDAMQLFLEKLDVKNYRVSSDTHVWNAVYVEGEWLHLDLTWDDPIMKDGTNTIKYDYFLITHDELKSKADNEHLFDEVIYKEVK